MDSGCRSLSADPQTALQVEGLAADPTAELALLQLPRSFAHLAHLGLRGTTLGANALCAMVTAHHTHCNHSATILQPCVFETTA